MDSIFLPRASRKIPISIVLIGSITTLGPQWPNFIPCCTDPLFNRLSEEYCPHPLARMKLVAYSHVCPALIDPVYHSVVGHDEEGNVITDDVIVDASPDVAAFYGYMSVIKFIDDLQTRHPSHEFSFFLWHVVAGQHGFWDFRWEAVRVELMKRSVNLSMILLDNCPIFVQLFSEISPTNSHIIPWFPTSPGHTFLLSGFMPPGELGGAVPSMMSAAHPAPSISVPPVPTIGVPLVTPWSSPFRLPAHETQYLDDPWAAPHSSQYTGSDVYAQDPTMDPFLDLFGDPQASSSAAVQGQPHPNLNNMSVTVPEAQGDVPMDWSALPHNSVVEEHQPPPHGYTEKINSPDDFSDANRRPMSSGSSEGMPVSDNEWTGALNLDGTRVVVQALMAAAIGDPKLSALPKELKVEPAVGPQLSIIYIEAWIRENKAPMVRLIAVDGTNHDDFDQLVQKIRTPGYAIVSWENRDRLLLAPLGEVLLCAAFPETGITKRPTSQPPRPVRKQPRKGTRQKKDSSDGQGNGSQKKEKEKPRQRAQPFPAKTSNSSSNDGSCGGVYPEAATVHQSPIPLQLPQPEQPHMPYPPSQVDVEPVQGEINPSSQWQQVDEFTQRQIISPPQFQQPEHAHPQPWEEFGAHREQLVFPWTGPGAASCMADPPNLKPEEMESDGYKFVDFDGNGDKYDGAL